MNHPGSFLVFLSVLSFAFGSPASAATPAQYFEQNCSSCHTVGGGPSVGPDLKNVTQRASPQWLIEFIRNPESKIAVKDPYAAKLAAEAQGMVMPGFPDVTPQFGEALLAYIAEQSGKSSVSPEPAVVGDAVRGRDLFLGRRRLTNGAAACIACHQASGLPVAGGRLGPNLSDAHQKLGGDRGLVSWLRNPPTKLMATIFREAPLNPDEAADLTAFLRTSTENAQQLNEVPLRRVQALGFGGSLLAFVIAGVVWRGRLTGVRRQVLRKRGGQ